MSIPVNHHYVSRCQIDCFFNKKERRIYYYDKESGFVAHKLSSKSLFSEKNANTRIGSEQTIDQASLEKDLKINFEDHYNMYLNVIKSSVETAPKAHADFDVAIEFFTRFGIIGDIRNPFHKREIDDIVNHTFYDIIYPMAAPELKQEMETHKVLMDKIKYSNSILYSEFADRVYQSMGGTKSWLNVIFDNRFFFLPDKSSIQKRAKINEYFNPDIEEIAMIGIPIHSKLFLHSESVKLNKLKQDILFPIGPYDGIGEVERINFSLYQMAYKRVACESKEYLNWFIDNLKEIEVRFHGANDFKKNHERNF